MSKNNSIVSGNTSRLTLADYQETARNVHTNQKVRISNQDAAKLHSHGDSIATRIASFFHNIAEALHLAKPSAMTRRQRMASEQFQNLIHQSGAQLPWISGDKKKPTSTLRLHRF